MLDPLISESPSLTALIYPYWVAYGSGGWIDFVACRVK